MIATVADPSRCLAEAIRVARDGAMIALVNHFRSGWPVMNWLEAAVDPLCRVMGWRSDLAIETVLREVRVDGALPRPRRRSALSHAVSAENRRIPPRPGSAPAGAACGETQRGPCLAHRFFEVHLPACR